MGFSLSHNDELNSLERGRAGADTPLSIQKVGPAAGRRTNARPKRLSGLFYLSGFILICSTGQIRRMGGRKARQKRIFHQTRGFNLLSFRRPCTEFDLT